MTQGTALLLSGGIMKTDGMKIIRPWVIAAAVLGCALAGCTPVTAVSGSGGFTCQMNPKPLYHDIRNPEHPYVLEALLFEVSDHPSCIGISMLSISEVITLKGPRGLHELAARNCNGCSLLSTIATDPCYGASCASAYFLTATVTFTAPAGEIFLSRGSCAAADNVDTCTVERAGFVPYYGMPEGK